MYFKLIESQTFKDKVGWLVSEYNEYNGEVTGVSKWKKNATDYPISEDEAKSMIERSLVHGTVIEIVDKKDLPNFIPITSKNSKKNTTSKKGGN